ncbi:hypothetical protein CN283_29685 [Bacillus thuringiensis]|uniref:hypothetical protein n=1 Tax=Bacillus thuringiensis TaxID=1428 RepID=UPI000BF43A7D|nr:hypothetical protein [Bacillus thuringiensis]PFB77479.1 hypothetical protein CN283_29685 [Bacillus thuringiensis]
MGFKIKKIKISANDALKKANEATAALERAAREEAERAAREAERAAREAEKAAREAAEEAAAAAAEEAKKQAEAIAAAAKKAEEEAARAAEAARTAAEEEAKRIAEEAAKAAEALKQQTEDFARDQIKKAVDSLVSEATTMSAGAQEFVKQIKEQVQNLVDLANIDALKRKLLDKAEELSEEYLKTKIQPLAEQIQLAAVPKVKLDLPHTEIKMDLFIFLLLLDDKEKEPSQNAIGVLTTQLEQSITKLEVPDVHVQFDLNKDKIKNVIKDKIESEKDRLVKAFLMTFFSDYVAVFDVIMKYLPK